MKRLVGNLKMGTKLLIAPLIATLFLLLLALISYKGLSEQKQAIDDLTNVRFKTYQNASEMVRQMTAAQKDVFKLLGFADAGADESKLQQLAKEGLQTIEQLKGLVANAGKGSELTPQERDFFQSSLKEIEEYETAVKKVIQMTSVDVSMALTMMAPLETRFQALEQKMKSLLEYEEGLNRERHAASVASHRFVLRAFGVMVTVAVLLSLFASISMARIVTSAVRQAMSAIRTIAEGDLTREMGAAFGDEIGELVRSVDAMRLKMADAVGQSVSMSLSLSDAASRQAASLEETSSSLEEMASMTRQNAANTTRASELMAETEAVIRSADKSMAELTKSMKEIAGTTEQTRKIIGIIDEIAFQTNLLALNAAVEAARAGEAGAGFAVVADEVRNLAMRAAKSAKSTSALTEDIVHKVKKGESLVAGTYEDFHAVTDRSSKVVGLIAEVAAASQEQSHGVDQINRAIADMNVVTQQNAASAEELASAMAMFRVKPAAGVSQPPVSHKAAATETARDHHAAVGESRKALSRASATN